MPRKPVRRCSWTGDHSIWAATEQPGHSSDVLRYADTACCVALGTNATVNLGPAFMDNQHDQRKATWGLADGSVQGCSRHALCRTP